MKGTYLTILALGLKVETNIIDLIYTNRYKKYLHYNWFAQFSIP